MFLNTTHRSIGQRLTCGDNSDQKDRRLFTKSNWLNHNKKDQHLESASKRELFCRWVSAAEKDSSQSCAFAQKSSSSFRLFSRANLARGNSIGKVAIWPSIHEISFRRVWDWCFFHWLIVIELKVSSTDERDNRRKMLSREKGTIKVPKTVHLKEVNWKQRYAP